MTFQTAKFIQKIKKAQICEDWAVQINYDTMTATTYNKGPDNTKAIALSEFSKSIRSILNELEEKEYITADKYFGYVSLTHSGWHALEMTVQSAIRFTFAEIFVPILVTVVANFIIWLIQYAQMVPNQR